MNDNKLLQILIDGQSEIKTEIKEIKTEVKELKTEVNGIKSDVKGLKTEVNGIKSDVKGLKTEVNGIKSDLNGLKTEVVSLHEEVRQNTARLEKLAEWLARIEDDAPTRDELEVVDEKVEKVAKHIGISV